MLHVALWADHSGVQFNFSLCAVASAIHGASTARAIRALIHRRSEQAHTPRQSKIVFTSDSLPRSLAAAVYNATHDAVERELPANRFTMQELLALFTEVPRSIFQVQKSSQPDEMTCVWSLIAMRSKPHVENREISSREMRVMLRRVRVATLRTTASIRACYDADIMLAEMLRRRCGLGRVDSRSWLFDHSTEFH